MGVELPTLENPSSSGAACPSTQPVLATGGVLSAPR
jgi:hypothetical protein